MDLKTKSDLLKFISSSQESVGDLATWIQSPQRRHHRHEFFGVAVASLKPVHSKQSYIVRDVGYGGCGLIGGNLWPQEKIEVGVPFDAELTFLQQSHVFSLNVRHTKTFHVGCEFSGMTSKHLDFLKGFLQYMEAALQVNQADSSNVFSAYRGSGWLNLMGHKGSLQFHIRQVPGPSGIEASLIFVMNGNHTYATWQDNRVEIGFLNGAIPSKDERQLMVRQIVSMLIGIRQGASIPDFSPVIERAVALLNT